MAGDDVLEKALGGLEKCKDKTVDGCIPGLPRAPIGSLAEEVVTTDISASPTAVLLHRMSHSLHKAAAVAVNSVQKLEPDTINALNSTFGDIFLAAGPFSSTLVSLQDSVTPSDPEGCLPWLDTQAPASVVYIGFGTSFSPPPEEFHALTEALEEAEVPFLWSLPERSKGWVPEGFVGRSGKVVEWAPQRSVLGHVAVGAHLTHCGWNSVIESVVSGVPLVCRPLPVAEQSFNERLVVDVWGIGVALEGGRLTRTAVIRAVERVLGEDQGASLIRRRILEMKRLVEEAAAEPNGNSVRNLNNFISIIISG